MNTVLIVEDQRMPRENMERMLAESGHYQLAASIATAKAHVSSLLAKTGYANRTRLAIAVAKKNFIIPKLEDDGV